MIFEIKMLQLDVGFFRVYEKFENPLILKLFLLEHANLHNLKTTNIKRHCTCYRYT